VTDYYTCNDCGGDTLACGCAEVAKAKRKADWAAQAQLNDHADKRVREYLDDNLMSGPDREAITLILRLAQRQIGAVRSYAT
jgi:hypothetical protein